MKLNTIKKIYDELNAQAFANVLTMPRIFATRSEDHWACYHGVEGDPRMYFNNRAIKADVARSLVYHEMVHQYVEEIMKADELDHHGEIFWAVYISFAPDDVSLFEVL